MQHGILVPYDKRSKNAYSIIDTTLERNKKKDFSKLENIHWSINSSCKKTFITIRYTLQKEETFLQIAWDFLHLCIQTIFN